MAKQIDELSRHIILYSKGWYKKSPNYIDDLKILVAKYNGNSPADINVFDVYMSVAEAFVIVNDQRKFMELFRRMFYDPLHDYRQTSWGITDYICNMLSLMGICTDKETLNAMGKPDYTYLPKAEY